MANVTNVNKARQHMMIINLKTFNKTQYIVGFFFCRKTVIYPQGPLGGFSKKC